jgi:hypothetical protein
MSLRVVTPTANFRAHAPLYITSFRHPQAHLILNGAIESFNPTVALRVPGSTLNHYTPRPNVFDLHDNLI